MTDICNYSLNVSRWCDCGCSCDLPPQLISKLWVWAPHPPHRTVAINWLSEQTFMGALYRLHQFWAHSFFSPSPMKYKQFKLSQLHPQLNWFSRSHPPPTPRLFWLDFGCVFTNSLGFFFFFFKSSFGFTTKLRGKYRESLYIPYPPHAQPSPMSIFYTSPQSGAFVPSDIYIDTITSVPSLHYGSSLVVYIPWAWASAWWCASTILVSHRVFSLAPKSSVLCLFIPPTLLEEHLKNSNSHS